MTAPVEIRALHALPMSSAAGRWLTPASLAVQIGVAPDVARSVLVGLRRRGLAEDDGSLPQAFARTTKGDWQLEQNERPRERRP
jgi:hypothetical protein